MVPDFFSKDYWSSVGRAFSNSYKGLVSSIGNFFSNVFDWAGDRWNDYTGITANQQNIDYQKEYNEQVWNRADTQYQRTVAGLRKAGLSAQLAAGALVTIAGQGAAPQRTVGNESAAMASLVNMITNLKQTEISNKLASAQADNIKADTAIKTQEAEGFGEYRAAQIMSLNAASGLNIAYMRLAQIDGQTRAQKNLADIQNTMMNSKYLNSLISLCEKNVDLVDSQIAENKANTLLLGSKVFSESAYRRYLSKQGQLIDKQIEALSSDILTDASLRDKYDAEADKTNMEVANSFLKFVVDGYAFKFSVERGDSPNATQLSESQKEEYSKQRKHDLLVKLISSGTTIAVTGLSSRFALPALLGLGGAGGKVKRKHKDLTLDDIDWVF